MQPLRGGHRPHCGTRNRTLAPTPTPKPHTHVTPEHR